jgi:hypothetical protein
MWGVTLDKRLTRPPHIGQVRKKTYQRMGMLGPLLNRKSDLSVWNGVLLYKQLIRPMMECVPLVVVRRPHPCPQATGFKMEVPSPCYCYPLCT